MRPILRSRPAGAFRCILGSAAPRGGRVLLLAAVAVLFLPAAWARAQEPGESAIPDRFRIRAGTLFATIGTDGELNTQTDNGTQIEFENDLGLPTDKTTLRVDGFWRIAGRHSLEFGYLDISRDAGTVLDRDIEWGGETFPVNGSVDAHFDSMYAFAAYRYDFIRKPKLRFGGTFGVTYTELDAGLEGEVIVGGQPEHRRVDTSLGVPVPLVGVAFNATPNKHFTWDAYLRGFYYNAGGFEGNEVDTGVRAEWYFTKHFGLGAGYELTRIAVPDYDDGERDGSMRYRVDGARLFLCFTF